MFYQRFTFRLILRLLLINLLAVLLGYLLMTTRLWFTITGITLVLLGAVASLYNYINQIRGDIRRFILAIKTRGHTLNFKNKSTQGSFPDLYNSFDDIIKTHKSIQLE